jgi:uncharacterized protein (TIGR02452 family)
MSYRDKLVEIYRDTQSKCRTGKFKTLECSESILYKFDDPALDIVCAPVYKTEILVVNDLVLNVAEKLFRSGHENIMVLNLASGSCPGGGVVRGAVAQEEDIFRKTNYFLSLTPKFYPIALKNMIYTGKVFVIKDENFIDLEKPFCVSMLAAHAIRNPVLTNGRYKQEDYLIMKNTVENIFKVAYLKKKEVLVLGALGCGAYNNPPAIIISIFNEYLKKYAGCFKKIVFAVYSRRDDNFDMFNLKLHRSFK